jgi:hypothetical protein
MFEVWVELHPAQDSSDEYNVTDVIVVPNTLQSGHEHSPWHFQCQGISELHESFVNGRPGQSCVVTRPQECIGTVLQ